MVMTTPAVVGLVLIHPQPEYGKRDAHREMNGAIHRLVGTRDVRSIWSDGEEEDRREKTEDPCTKKVDAGMAT